MVGFLIDDQSFCSAVNEFAVLMVFHWADFDADGRDEVFNGFDAFLQVALADKLWVFAGDEEDISEAFFVEMTSLFDNLLDSEGGSEDGVVAREAAVLAVIHTLVGDVERGEESHGAPVVSTGDFCALAGEVLELGAVHRLQKSLECPEGRGTVILEVAELVGKAHAGRGRWERGTCQRRKTAVQRD